MVGDPCFYSVFAEFSLYFRTFFVQIISCEFLQVGTFTTFSINKLISCKSSDLKIFSNTLCYFSLTKLANLAAQAFKPAAMCHLKLREIEPQFKLMYCHALMKMARMSKDNNNPFTCLFTKWSTRQVRLATHTMNGTVSDHQPHFRLPMYWKSSGSTLYC